MGVLAGEPFEGQLRKPGEQVTVASFADGEEHQDRLGQQASGDESEDLGSGLVEPLGIVDHADQRT